MMGSSGFQDQDSLSVKQAAKVFEVHQNHIYRLIDKGSLPAFRIGRNIRIPGAAVRRMLATGTEKPNSAETELGLT